MIYVFWAVLILLTFLIQGSISFLHIKLNLTVILVCYIGIRKGEIKGMLFGALIGILEDSLSGIFIGPNLLSKGIIGYLSSSLSRRIFIWTPFLGVINIFFLTFLDCTIIFILRSVFDKMPVSLGTALFILLIKSMVNAPLGIFLKPKDVL